MSARPSSDGTPQPAVHPAAGPSAALPTATDGSFGGFVAAARRAGRLVVQPRMGMGSPTAMRAGLRATRDARALTVGTVTLDSYTRVGDLAAARGALADGAGLNGYPLVTHAPAVTRGVLEGLEGPMFPVQVRHGSACPQDIVRSLVGAGLHATEGGPVSYCLPYSRTPLREAVGNWLQACDLLLEARDRGTEPHVETFGGCMMGQLCPPGLLVALSVLEGLFFAQRGLRSVSLSYAQQTHPEQDEEALHALDRLAAELLPDIDRHIVVYTYMGVFPRTPRGARRLLEDSARLAVRTGAARLIVKTTAEAHRIPTVEENVAALEIAARAADEERTQPRPPATALGTGVHEEAAALVGAVLDLSPDLAVALPRAFERGYLDVPYCLHPDNSQRTRSYIDPDGRLRWADIGVMPLRGLVEVADSPRMTSSGLLGALAHVEGRYDRPRISPKATAPALLRHGTPPHEGR
ncbi:methylaspartate mutase [Streptomyces sp. TR06-5]|uniref:methylaspartate mutase n=1 Tax=unclassified Streptomyces TaxID=2593676 RepID=UPI0039A3B29D